MLYPNIFVRKVTTGRSALWLLLPFVLLFCVCSAYAQEIQRVRGKVVSNVDGSPVFGATIYDLKSKSIATQTSEDGTFVASIVGNTFRVQLIGWESTTVRVKSAKDTILVKLAPVYEQIGTAVVQAERPKRDSVTVEPTYLEVHGHYLRIPPTVIRIPNELFNSNNRLVMQPVVSSEANREHIYIRPMVFDGQEYNSTQRRMYDFDLETLDPLAPYITIRDDSLMRKEHRNKNNILVYEEDSIWVADPKDYFTCDFYLSLEDYVKVVKTDSQQVAQGTVDPLRFLEFDFDAAKLTDSRFYPAPETQPRATKGNMNLFFAIGKSDLDLTNEQNRREIDKLNAQLDSIIHHRNVTLQSFSIEGTASPDGTYAKNQKLADARMRNTLNYIVGRLDSETRQDLEVHSNVRVATWQEVADLLREDGLTDQASAIERIVARYKDQDTQSREMRKLDFYKMLLDDYLPRLRQVEYTMNYTIRRKLTYDEIKELYAEAVATNDFGNLSRFEYFTLFRGEENDSIREQQLRHALQAYPKFTVAACDLAELLINDDRPDSELLADFAGKDAPAAVNVNHVIALLDKHEYWTADSLANFIPQSEETLIIKSVVGMLNGHEEENYQVVATTSPLNRVVCLLAVKHNKEAEEAARLLPTDQALSHYLLATCLWRNGIVDEAQKELQEAFRLDPSLEEKAKLDGDVNRLLLK
ncbi:MAG: hypothetical protein IKI05_09255 [Bacteroidaceae bacterium]|nr:hypothetical protein [Bacteroidaceae bacterium]